MMYDNLHEKVTNNNRTHDFIDLMTNIMKVCEMGVLAPVGKMKRMSLRYDNTSLNENLSEYTYCRVYHF